MEHLKLVIKIDQTRERTTKSRIEPDTEKGFFMIITVDATIAKEHFKQYDRDYYSFEGIEALLDYYNEVDENMEFDVIAICCDCSEYGENCALGFSDLIANYEKSVKKDYVDDWNEMDDDKKVRAIVDELEQYTTVLHVPNGNYIVFDF